VKAEAVIGDLLSNGDRERATFETTLRTASGDRVPYENHIVLLRTADGEFEGTVGALRDVTDRRERERILEALHDATRTMMNATTREEVCEVAADAAKRVLGYPIAVVRLLADDGETLVPTAMTTETREQVGERPAYSIRDTPAGRAYESGESAVYDDIHNIDDDYEKGDAHAAMYAPLGDHGVISIADTRTDVFDRADIGLANVLGANTETALDRLEYERQVTDLHDATRAMIGVEIPEEVREIAVEAARSTLGLRVCTAWLYDDAAEALRPAASSEEARALFETFPTYTAAGDSLSWQAFTTGETRVYEDVSTVTGRHDPGTPIRADLIVPFGDYGVLNAGSTEASAFDAADENTLRSYSQPTPRWRSIASSAKHASDATRPNRPAECPPRGVRERRLPRRAQPAQRDHRQRRTSPRDR
jgi:PAS domain-containing protein